MVGAEFKYDEFFKKFSAALNVSEKEFDEILFTYEDWSFDGIKRKNGLTVIVDGMNGKYVYIGFVLKKSNDGDLNACVSERSLSTEEVQELIKKEFNVSTECYYHAFTHWS